MSDHDLRTDLADMDLDLVHHWLSTDAYWSLGRSREAVATAAEHSLNFGAFDADGRQVAYARVVTDHANFAWLCDVYVDRPHRGRGLGTRLVAAVIDALDELGIPRTLLATRDAHQVYSGFGFGPLPDPTMWMIRTPRPA
ncbi:GNAT superfamily N-acetyltransferase [Nocardioides cavernae]|uniref:GNAT superfamily N-acetyltransferase n=1 Tax=Nocardioides cavernae TaxID=1921566 RepID=A0A7Y9H2C9_9ACTN|nr:GNAT family N-acetyltransferase [Nocardioides cavernae]NYE36697.1 GNAT superfamily N-acetyltransferase [Nocardioides cavernae]